MIESKTFSKQSLIAYGTFSAEDISQINNCRGQHNRLGFAYQLIFIKLFNSTPAVAPFEVVEEIVTYASMQLCLENVGIDIYEEKTIIAHQKEIVKYLQLKKFDNFAQRKLESFIFDIALRLEAISLLKLEAIRFLKESKVLSPPTVVLDRLLAAKRREARKKIFHNVHSKLSLQAINKLNELLMVETFSKLEFLRTAPGRASSDTILNLVRRLEIIQETGVLNVDLSAINTNYQKILTKEIRIYSVGRIKALEVEHRYTALVCFLHQVYQDTTDFLIDAYSKVLNRSYGKAHRETEQAIEEKNKKIRAALKNYEQLKAMVRDKSIPDAELRLRINQKLGKALKSDEELNLISDKYCDTFKTFTNRLNYLRQFSPSFIKVLDVEPELAQKPGVIEAIKLLRVMNETKRYKWPKQLPVSFIPKKLRQQIISNGKVDKRAWECAVLLKIRDDIKNSNVAVKSSKRFGKFQDLFMPIHEWEKRREEFFRKAKLPQSADLVYDYWKNRLNEAYDIYFKCEKRNPYVKVKNGKWVLSRDANQDLSLEKQIELKKLKEWMGRQMQKITLPNLLIDVDNELHFTELFMFPSQQGKRVIQDICDIIITLMAHGCNIGIYTMPQLVKETSYERLKRITDWQFTDEALRTALTWSVNAISKSPISKILGGGKTSGSDAHLVKFHEKVLSQEFNPNFPGFALAFYTFVADNYAPYRSKPIECNEGEAPHALDGALYNESDLSLEEHYTDTRAAATVTFTAFAFLGLKYNPRIRGIQKHHIFRIDKDRSYGKLESLLKHRDNLINMDVICKHWDKAAHFYASIAYGHVTASVALKKLLALNSKNDFYNAILQIGRILKTESTLMNMTDPVMRKARNRTLLKGEEVHQLARDIGYGNQGKLTARDIIAQQNCCNASTLIIACIILKQYTEIGRIIENKKLEQAGFDPSLLKHISQLDGTT